MSPAAVVVGPPPPPPTPPASRTPVPAPPKSTHELRLEQIAIWGDAALYASRAPRRLPTRRAPPRPLPSSPSSSSSASSSLSAFSTSSPADSQSRKPRRVLRQPRQQQQQQPQQQPPPQQKQSQRQPRRRRPLSLQRLGKQPQEQKQTDGPRLSARLSAHLRAPHRLSIPPSLRLSSPSSPPSPPLSSSTAPAAVTATTATPAPPPRALARPSRRLSHAAALDVAALESLAELDAHTLPPPHASGLLGHCNSRSAAAFRRSGTYAAVARASVREARRASQSPPPPLLPVAEGGCHDDPFDAGDGNDGDDSDDDNDDDDMQLPPAVVHAGGELDDDPLCDEPVSLLAEHFVLAKRSSMSLAGRQFWLESVPKSSSARRSQRLSVRLFAPDDTEQLRSMRFSSMEEPSQRSLHSMRLSAATLQQRERDENDFRLSNARLPERRDVKHPLERSDWQRPPRTATMHNLGRYSRSSTAALPHSPPSRRTVAPLV